MLKNSPPMNCYAIRLNVHLFNIGDVALAWLFCPTKSASNKQLATQLSCDSYRILLVSKTYYLMVVFIAFANTKAAAERHRLYRLLFMLVFFAIAPVKRCLIISVLCRSRQRIATVFQHTSQPGATLCSCSSSSRGY